MPVAKAELKVKACNQLASHFKRIQITTTICRTVASFPRNLGLTLILCTVIWMTSSPTSNKISRPMIVPVSQSGTACK